ncbi:phage tail terminator-like protein [Duganella sp. BJB475]|uniref:phage tail terminator-like protein n=1 Tax=Duganella sp. BJB475 TaxID=2233914 RepID=UPI001314B74E|nr:phage tail terminator-like protein [Duganella sp. BJB475]
MTDDPIIHIRNALEAALASITPAIDIVHENESYDPVPDQPYCEPYLLVGLPDNSTIGSGYYQERGVFQINLQYPPLVGTLACATRAGLIRNLFKRGATFADGGITVQIDLTPGIGMGDVETGRWKQIIRCRWHADIFT